MNPIDALSVLVWRAVISVPPLLEVDCLSQIVDRPRNWIAADLARVMNGVLAEHWDRPSSSA
jgi:hypothetical protein